MIGNEQEKTERETGEASGDGVHTKFEHVKHSEFPEDTPSKEWRECLEERLRAVEGVDSYGTLSASQLCLVPDVVMPHKFKMPDFEKYDGTTCPRSHLVIYCNKMANHAYDDKLMMHCFQNSLGGSALRWYMQLERTRVRRWQDLADAFMRHYKHNQDLAPDREDLRNMEKKENESFREYAHRWREKAAEVQPPMSEKELVSIFFETLKPPFYNNMLGLITTNFSDMLLIGERIEKGIKHGRVDGHDPLKKHNTTRKREEVNATRGETPRTGGWVRPPTGNQASPYIAAALPVTHNQPFAPQQRTAPNTAIQPGGYQGNQPRPYHGGQQVGTYGQSSPTNYRAPEPLDPIPISYTELFPQLLKSKQIVPVPLKPLQPPYPSWYDPEVRCEYHAGAPGHVIENCRSFKYKVQQLVRAGWLKFDGQPSRPDVNKNPLPNHGGHNVATVGKEEFYREKLSIAEIKTPLKFVCKLLIDGGYLRTADGRNISAMLGDKCLYHGGNSNHTMDDCEAFKEKLQALMDSKLVIFYTGVKGAADICMASPESPEFDFPKLVIRYQASAKPPPPSLEVKPLVIRVPRPFEYKSSKAVPWEYACQAESESDADSPAITNITGLSQITRSGRHYGVPDDLDETARVRRAEIKQGKGRILKSLDQIVFLLWMNARGGKKMRIMNQKLVMKMHVSS